MIEKLFRAKREDNGEWLYWNEFGRVIDIKTDKPLFINTKPAYINHYDITEETVCQYTGLKDKNGKKIFEGDRLRALSRWHKAEGVVIDKGKDCFGDALISVSKKGTTEWTVEYSSTNTYTGFKVYGIDRRWSRELTKNRIYNGECEVIGNKWEVEE